MALVLATMMLLVSVSALAADGTPADPAPTATTNPDGSHWAGDTHWDTIWNGNADNAISIGGLAAGDQVKFYKVLDYDQTADKTVANAEAITPDGSDWHAAGWKVIAPFISTAANDNGLTLQEFKDILSVGISSTLAGKIAKNATSDPTDNKFKVTVASAETTATVSAPGAGLYVAIITPANAGVMYNPIFVASDYYTTTGGDVSRTWTPVTEPLSYANSAMAKKSEITLTKEAAEASETDNEKVDGATGSKYDSAKAVAVGDVIDYTVKTTIPEFANNYLSPLFVITDKLDSGLALDQNSIKVFNATVSDGTWNKGTQIEEAASNFTVSDKSATGYKITFTPQYLLNLSAAQPIIVEYKASITEKAVTSVNEKDNTVTLEYSHEPSVDNEGEGKKLRDKTHHYTFTIDGEIWGTSSYHSTEVVKVGIDKNGNEIWSDPKTLDNGNQIGALEGAEFKLYTQDPATTTNPAEYNKGAYKDATATDSGSKILSDANGRLYINGQTTSKGISGLDAGEYWLVEQKAPAGYIKQQAPVHIEIIPTYFEEYTFTETEDGTTYTITCDDVLQSYIVKIDGEKTAEYVFTYPNADTNGVRSSDTATAVAGTDTDPHGDIYIGNTGKIISDTTNADYAATDDDGKIKNTQGTELPSTGGMGTTIFYVAGSILVLAAAILLITKRRMGSED